jgi:periplasmic mercuric ion binding protein
MKTSAMMILFVILTGIAYGQKKNTEQVVIMTSAECDMCQDRIEGALRFEKGVKKADLDLKTKLVTVTFDTRKTSPEKLRQVIAAQGYHADDVAPTPEAYKKLPACCQKGGHSK